MAQSYTSLKVLWSLMLPEMKTVSPEDEICYTQSLFGIRREVILAAFGALIIKVNHSNSLL